MIDPQAPDFVSTPADPSRPSYHYHLVEPRPAQPSVSIVTPFYNSGEVFHDTAWSVLGQSFQDWEWLIVDDGTTREESLALLDEYRHRDARIRIIGHRTNRGLSAARNTGFEAARSEYIYLIDDDDLIEPTTIEKCLWHLESYPELGFANSWSVGFGALQYLWREGFDQPERFLEANRVTGRAMVRRSVHATVRGYDEAMLGGMEDWDFWLRCADAGTWGGTIPEYLDWYRRRHDHGDRWSNLDNGARSAAVREGLRQKYSRLYQRSSPQLPGRRPAVGFEQVSGTVPFGNILAKPAGTRRLLLIVPWMVMGGSDRFNLDLVGRLRQRQFEITICTTVPSDNAWLSRFARLTPDVFSLPAFLRVADYPRFLLYLIDSRQIDAVLISNSYLGYQLLPFLRAHRPDVTYVDFCHMEEEWRNGGYPRAAVAYQELLDLNLVITEHLKEWMVVRGADPARVEVVHAGIDPRMWDPASIDASPVRADLGLTDATPAILYAGRICAQKQPKVFAEVIRRLALEEKCQFVAVVAGDGEDLPFLRWFVAEHGLERHLRCLGAVAPDRMPQLHAAADILFLPSAMEGLALVIYEAMAMETVPVSADVGGQRELVTPECGVLVPPGEGEIERYVGTLKRLLESPSLRRRMAAAARERVVAEFGLDRMGDSVVELLGRADKLAALEPRPRVGRGLGLECAMLAVEYDRLQAEPAAPWRLHSEGSAEEISRYIVARKLFKALCFRLASRPGGRWLLRFRNVGRRVLGST